MSSRSVIPVADPRRRILWLGAFLFLGLSSARGQTIHVVAVGDTNDPRIGPYCQQDLSDVSRLFFSHVPERRLRYVALDGNQVNRPSIFNAINALAVQPADAVIFYYSGHGAMDQNRRPYIALPGGQPLYRSEVRKAIEARKPRLTVLLTDICSVLVPVRPKSYAFAQAAPTEQIAPLFSALFLEARGVADINGSSPGEVGLCDPDKRRGGLFTFCFVDVLADNSTQRLSWQQVMAQTRTRVDAVFKQGWPEGYDLTRDGLSGIQPTQTPHAIELPGGMAFGAFAQENNGDGVLVVRVEPDSAAARSGLEPQDVILTMNGRAIRSTADYLAAVRASGPMLRYQVRKARDSQVAELTARLAAATSKPETASTTNTPTPPPPPPPSPPPPSAPPAPPVTRGPVFGATCKDTPDGRGVRVTRLVPNSPAARAGLEINDILTAINGRVIRNEADYAEAIDSSGPVADIVAINFRDGQVVRFSVRLNK